MTLDPAARNLLAWHTVPCDYAPCSQPVGRRCVSSSGARTIPHAARLRALDWWLNGAAARDAEVAELQQGIDQRDSIISADQDGLRTTTTERDDLRTSLAAANTEITGLNDQVTALTKDLTVTKAEYATYVKTHPDVPVPPVPTDPPGWKPLLTENFDTLDTSVWDVRDRYGMGGRDDVAMAKNVSVVDGKLRIWMRKEQATSDKGETRQVTTGLVFLRQKLPNIFRCEFVISVPWQPGCWPGSLWWTNTLTEEYGGEFDPWEIFYTKRKPKSTLHSLDYNGKDPQGVHVMDQQVSGLADYDTGKHTVTVEKLAASWTTWVDGKLWHTYDKTSPAWRDSDHADPKATWLTWINLQSGASGGKVDVTTDWTKTYMDVESVRVWVPA